MTELLAAAAAFILLHLLVSGTRMRDVLTGRIGQGPYMGLFSLASIGLLVWLGFAFGKAHADPANPVYWTAPTAARWVQAGVQLVAVVLAVVGLTTPNPTSVAQLGVLDKPDAVRGVLRITRHPFLWGAALWGLGHLLVNGNLAAIILFGAIGVLAIAGTFSIDAKRKRVVGAAWDAFAAQTSNVPFGAVASGRQSVKFGEIGWARLVGGVAIWAALLFGHVYMFGVSAKP